MENFNNFFQQQQQIWNINKNLLQQSQQQSSIRNEISSTDKGAISSGSAILTPSKLAQAQPPHSTNRDLTALSIDNRLYMDSLRQQQQARQNSFSNGALTISPAGGGGVSRDSNNNGLNSQSNPYSSQKLLNRLDIDTIRSNINSHRSLGSCSGGGGSMIHHQHGTILFNTLNGGALGAGSNSMMPGSSADCFNGPDLVDSTTPPPTAISMPPASSASSSSSTISTNIGLNRNSSQDGNTEKIKTPNSIRGKPRTPNAEAIMLNTPKMGFAKADFSSRVFAHGARHSLAIFLVPKNRTVQNIQIGRETVRRKTRLAEFQMEKL